MYSLSMKLTRTYDNEGSENTQKDKQKLRGRRVSWLSKALSRKASPTVSLVNTNASCTTTANSASSVITLPLMSVQPPPSSIPFPSAPIPVPTRTPDHEYPPKRTPFAPYTLDDLENAASNDQLYGNVNEKSVSFDSSPWHVQLHRRRSQSCLVQTFFHDENNQPDPPRRPWRTRKDAARTRATSHSARAPMFIPTPEPQPVVIVKSPKERKASKKAQADMRFLAAVYRSLKWFIDYRELEDALAEDSESTAQGGEMTEQDRIFLCRLYENLVHQGCQPILLNVSCPSNPTPLCSPDSSRSSVSPQAVDIPASPVLSEAPLSAPPEVLTPPQVVASLILRHRDRSTVRPRSSSPTTRATKGSSPLRECVLLATV